MAVRGGPRCPRGGARLEEAEQGRGRRDRSPGGGTGAGGGASGPAGLRTGTPGDGDARPSPIPRCLAASRRGGAGHRSHSASPKFDSPPREESRGRGPSGHRAPPASQAGTRISIARCRIRKSGGAAGLRTRRRPRHPPRGAPDPLPPKFTSYASGPAARDPRGAMEEPLGSPPAALSALEKNVAELTVMDVYDIASLVGHEFERVIDQHGCESIARLMPKVVRVLEILEVLVSRHHVAPELDELRLELDRLRVERMDRIEKERKHQKVGGGLSLPVRARGSNSVGAIRFWAALVSVWMSVHSA